MEFENQTLDYVLPEDKIAKYPLPIRHNSKLLVYKNQTISHDHFYNLSHHIASGTLLVFNNTKVFHARLHFYTDNGRPIEVFCLEPSKGNDPALSLASTKSCEWICMVGGAKKWKFEKKIRNTFPFKHQEVTIEASMIERHADMFRILFEWNSDEMTFADVLQTMGELPLPPYMNRKATTEDENRYQTVYAKKEGSVAAPTAGLHFTDEVLATLEQKGCSCDYVTLHVGAGTFKPIKTDVYTDHDMHEELIDVSSSSIKNMRDHSGKIIAVGTTSLRTIESLYWMGVKAIHVPDISITDLQIKQWEAYELKQDISPEKALQALMDWMRPRSISRLVCKTKIMITPKYHLRIAEGLITNFHQPKSTLLLLIAAVTGKNWEKIYAEALKNDYRFLSYGDSSLLMKNELHS